MARLEGSETSPQQTATLQESEERFRRIVDTIPGHVCTLSAAGEVQLLNRQLLEYFGKTPEELKNWATSDAVHPDDLPRVIEKWRRSVETGDTFWGDEPWLSIQEPPRPKSSG